MENTSGQLLLSFGAMAWTTIMLIGDEPLRGAAHPVEFVGPDAHGYGNVVQFFT